MENQSYNQSDHQGRSNDLKLPLKENRPGKKEKQLPVALLGTLSYISILCLIPLFISTKGTFEKFHAIQGMALFVLSLFGYLIAWALPGALGSILFAITFVLEVVLTIIGTMNVINGTRERLPLVGKLLIALNMAE